MKPVRITKLAQTEIEAAANWFEAAEKIGINPEGFQKLFKDIRHVNLEQFKERGSSSEFCQTSRL